MTNPHDALFQYTFSQPEYAAQLIRGNLPAAIAERIDWGSLERIPGSFVDEECAWRHTDLLFRAKLSGRDALIYLLFEHQSTSDRLMALRLLGYLTRIWEKVVKGDPNAKLLPAVIPLVLYHGKRGWSAPTRFVDLIDLDEQAKQTIEAIIPDFRYIIDDLSGQSDEQLRTRAIGHLGLLTLLSLQRLPNHPDPEAAIKRMGDLAVAVINAPSGVQALAAILWYLFKVSDPEPSAIKEWLEVSIGGRALEAYMTAAERMTEETRKIALAEGEAKGRVEGEAKGRVEGEAKGRAEVLRKLLTLKFGVLSAESEERLSKAGIEDLDRWSERVLSAQRVEEVFA